VLTQNFTDIKQRRIVAMVYCSI